MKSRLDLIEAQLQSFIEGSSVFLAGGARQNLLANRLVQALNDALVQEENGQLIAPTIFTIFVAQENLSIWSSRPELFDTLASLLHQTAEANGLTFLLPPSIRLAVDPRLQQDDLVVIAEILRPDGSGTAALMADGSLISQPKRSQDGSFLYVDGVVYSLKQSVINIGRREENHIVINDPRISRNHAQIRAVQGSYVIFDLNSTGGTFVNGVRITQQRLKPGDVISLSGVPLVFGEENADPGGSTNAVDLRGVS